ncbi:MAG: hypothetical protein KDK03_16970 [Rhodobacteraceae bacterium]|nr:hypothetical protein [Paracoccaceae bacterium]
MRQKQTEPASLDEFIWKYGKGLGSVDERSKDEEERWILSRTFENFYKLNKFAKTNVIQRDNPDFLLEIEDFRLGVEVTEAIPPEAAEQRRKFARADAASGQPVARLSSEFYPCRGNHPYSVDEELASATAVVLERIQRKAESAKNYEGFDALWLIIYLNPFFAIPNPSLLSASLKASIKSGEVCSFDCIILRTDAKNLVLWGYSRPFSL